MMPTLIDHLWQSTFVAGVATLLVLLLRHNAASVRYWVWFAASVKFLLPFSVLIMLGAAFGLSEAQAPSVEGGWTVLAGRVAEPMTALASPSAAVTFAEPVVHGGSVGAAEIAIGIWLLGVIVVLGVWLVRWRRLAGMVRAAVPLHVDHIDRIVGSIPVKATSSSVEPGVFGILRSVIIVPPAITERLTDAQLRAVLAHEMCHVRRRDNLTAAIHMLVEALFWFHPLVWWVGARLLDERERACDEAVLASGIDPDAYAEGILEICRCYVESPLPCAAGVGGGRSLRARVERIVWNRGWRPLGIVRKAVLSGITAAVVAVPIGLGLIQPQRAGAQPAAGDGLAFSSVSIEAVAGAVGLEGSLFMDADGRLTATHVPLRNLIAFAYGVDAPLVVGPPELDSLRYTIRGETTPRSGPEGLADYRAMMRNLLADRFDLELRREARTMPIVALVASSNAAALLAERPGNPGVSLGSSIRFQPGSVTLNDAPLEPFRHWLSLRLNRPVVDRTGLTGQYSFRLVWGSSADGGVTSLAVPNFEQLAPSLESQLGLSLLATEGTVETLVVERVAQADDFRPARRAIDLDTAILDRYVGYYGIAEIGWIVRVGRGEDHLVIRVNADRPVAVLPSSETAFFAETTDAEIEFVVEEGRIQALVMRTREVTTPMWGASLDAAAAEAMLAEIEAHYAAQAPVPGGDEIVQRIARVLAGEEVLPVDSGDFDPARSIHDALERELPESFAARGELVSVSFDSVNPMGRDVYRVSFEHLALDIVLGLDAAGRITSLVYRVGDGAA